MEKDPNGNRSRIRTPLMVLHFDDYYETVTFLKILERKAFVNLMYPQVTYRNRKLQSCEEKDRENIEYFFIDLYAYINKRPMLRFRLLGWVCHYEHLYQVYCRLNRRKSIPNFYCEVVRQLFFYLYEANDKIRDEHAEDYFEKFKHQSF